MPRPLDLSVAAIGGVVFAAAVILCGSAAAAEIGDCERELRLDATGDRLVELRVTAPCEPYARVDIAYGPFLVTEETSHQGRVDLRLPRLADMPEAAAQIGDTVLFAALPQPAGPAPGYVALLWSGAAALELSVPAGPDRPDRLALGFPLGHAARRAEVLVFEGGAEVPAAVDIALTAASCGEAPVDAAILSSELAARVVVQFPAEACDGDGFVRIALPAGDAAP